MKYDNQPLTPMNLFTISDEDAMSLRSWAQSTADMAQLLWLYEQLCDAELQVAYTSHVVEERIKELDQ